MHLTNLQLVLLCFVVSNLVAYAIGRWRFRKVLRPPVKLAEGSMRRPGRML